jgi:hypothetical protein
VRRDQLEAGERQPGEFAGITDLGPNPGPTVSPLSRRRPRVGVRCYLRGDEVAARRERVDQGRDDLGGLVRVRDEMQDGDALVLVCTGDGLDGSVKQVERGGLSACVGAVERALPAVAELARSVPRPFPSR